MAGAFHRTMGQKVVVDALFDGTLKHGGPYLVVFLCPQYSIVGGCGSMYKVTLQRRSAQMNMSFNHRHILWLGGVFGLVG
jgi:hypothetical protein